MVVNKEHIRNVFLDYVKAYDLNDTKIALKVAHTLRVADLCEEIATSVAEYENLSKQDIEIAWLCGMLHDIGRFEQCRLFDTFVDSISLNHAKLSSYILFGKTKSNRILSSDIECNISIRDFIEDSSYDEIIYDAIYVHNAFEIDDALNDKTKAMARILRDADKIDIFRVNVETPLEEIYNCDRESIYNSTITSEVYSSLFEKITVPSKLKKGGIDYVIGHISLIFGIEYRISIEIARRLGYYDQLINFNSNNEQTNQELANIREFVNSYIDNSLNENAVRLRV